MAEEKSIKIKKGDLWKYSTFVLLAIVVIMGVMFSRGGCTGQVISEEEAEGLFLNYVDTTGADLSNIEITNIEKSNGLYAITFNYQGAEYPYSYYVSLDGSLIGMMYEYSSKSDKPVVELFVMSYCPYGTQAEKGIIPVAELLGDKIDFRIRYVYYVMHSEKEITENLREYCIQENEPEKFLDYMTCFLEGNGIELSGYITEGNDVNTCLAQAGIDTTALQTCMTETDEEFTITENLEDESKWLSGYYPLFNVDADLNKQYGVGGSPTLVINGEQVSSSRDPTSYLNAICQAFTNAPKACGEKLSSQTPSPYFGWEGTGSDTSAQC